VCSLKKSGTINPDYSRIRIHSFKGVDIPVSCRMCLDPKPCIGACPGSDPIKPVGSILHKDDDTGAILVDVAKCIAKECKNECSRACLARAITFHPNENYPLICDLCGGDPECVKECPENCLEFIAGPADYLYPKYYAYPPEKLSEFLKDSIYYYRGREEEK
jgi:Fe-S-cluster-containing hydrogenase component 2